MPSELIAVATSAGLLEREITERRPHNNEVVKGGYINLIWEGPAVGAFAKRTIYVTRKRAFQAMNALEKHEETT